MKRVIKKRRKNPHHTANNEPRSAIRQIPNGIKIFRGREQQYNINALKERGLNSNIS